MNAIDTAELVARCLKTGTGLWVDTDFGDFDLFGEDLAEAWDSLAPGESFVVLGIIVDAE